MRSLFKRLFLLFFFPAATLIAKGQNITGTWEGDIVEDGEFLQINIVQTGNKVCGYTWDYVYANEGSYCKALFTGYYNKEKDRWFLQGSSFLQNSGTHVLMQLLFSISKVKGTYIMDGFCRLKPRSVLDYDRPSSMRLRKVSNKPFTIPPGMKSCIDENRKKPPVVKPPVPKPAPAAPPRPPQKKDPVKVPLPSPRKSPDSIAVLPPKKADPVAVPALPLPERIGGRTNKEIRRIIVHERKLTLTIYDNAETDGDSISIYYNGKLLRSHLRLSEKPIVIGLDLDPGTSIHSFVMYAENLGSIPPNTALIIFNDPAGKRYELFSKSTLDENAMLVFEYKPSP